MDQPVNRRIGAIPTATGGIARLAYTRMKQAGILTEPLLKKAKLTVQQMLDPGTRLSVYRQIHFLNLAASALRDEFLGFHLAKLFDLRQLGLLYYVPASSQILGDALQRLARYSSIANECLCVDYHDGASIKIGFSYVGVSRHQDRHQIEFFLTVLIRLCRQLTGCRVAPQHVTLAHRRSDVSTEFAAFIGAGVDFGSGVDEVIFAATSKQLPVVSADPYLNDLLISNCEQAISHRQMMRDPFRSKVENAIAPLLPHGKARAAEIARKLSMSQRTFTRRLLSQNLTFSTILECLRRDLAHQYFADPDLSISQIAWLLGYREPSAFAHAFKRWTGMSPRAARNEINC